MRACGADATAVRQADELASVDALTLPGGESTTMSRLLRVFGLEAPLRERLAAGMPTMSTCAGLILLSKEVLDGRPDQITFDVFDAAVRRNAYGRQVESFEADVKVQPLGIAPFPGVFIRAPQIEHAGGDTEVIATLDGKPVGIASGPHIGLTFHPEMTDDLRLHRHFLEVAQDAVEANAA